MPTAPPSSFTGLLFLTQNVLTSLVSCRHSHELAWLVLSRKCIGIPSHFRLPFCLLSPTSSKAFNSFPIKLKLSPKKNRRHKISFPKDGKFQWKRSRLEHFDVSTVSNPSNQQPSLESSPSSDYSDIETVTMVV